MPNLDDDLSLYVLQIERRLLLGPALLLNLFPLASPIVNVPVHLHTDDAEPIWEYFTKVDGTHSRERETHVRNAVGVFQSPIQLRFPDLQPGQPDLRP